MSKTPRASLSITVLRDEDYAVLMASEGGLEAFGAFTSMLLVGRERLGASQARQMSGTDSLRFDDKIGFIASLARITEDDIIKAVDRFKKVADDTGRKPWMYLDKSKHLVIRSFFKFNAPKEWGGPRPNSGRPPKEVKMESGSETKRNQDGFQNNHLDSSSSSSSSSSSISSSLPPTPSQGEEVVVAGTIRPDEKPPSKPLRSQAKHRPTPEQISALTEWAVGVVDKRFEMDDWVTKLAGYCRSYELDWVEGAILVTNVNAKTGQFDRYLNGVLCRWFTAGEPSHAEIRDAKSGQARGVLPPSTAPTNEIRAPKGWSMDSKPRQGAAS